jgi:type II secretory pathway pseudopilin PulG
MRARGADGVTLGELLCVIVIVGLLAALLLPALGRTKSKATVQRARLEMDRIVSAIAQYDATYGRYPVSGEALSAAAELKGDMTYGGVIEQTHQWIAGPGRYLTNNCELVAVLLDLEYYGEGAPTINAGHVKNPRGEKFLNAKMRDGTNALSGVGVDGLYRDPWGSPYLVTLDFNRDGRTRDFFYSNPAVSEDPGNPAHGLNGLVKSVDAQSNLCFEVTEPIIVWSAGPDRLVNPNEKANRGVNRDNILSWRR